ncbi:peptidoglycan DD-metalloendopeptidase family protein [Tessaracoccus sp. Z1128]
MRALLLSLGVLLTLTLTPLTASAEGGFLLEPPLGGRVLRGFDAPPSPYAAGHRGVDLAGDVGSEVLAAAAGRVFFAGHVAGRGTVSVDHGNGWRTTYQPVIPGVRKGDVVATGDRIGTLEAGHCAGSSCLHWGLTDGGSYLDPTAYLSVPVIRLLPAGARPSAVPQLSAAHVAAVGSRPVRGPVSSPFGMRRHPVSGEMRLHDGVDIAAACGTAVVATLPGLVVDASFHVSYGYRVRIDHGGGLVMAYTHLPGLDVREGRRVRAGERIGRVGTTGLSTGCHLHWMAWRDGALLDPLSLE